MIEMSATLYNVDSIGESPISVREFVMGTRTRCLPNSSYVLCSLFEKAYIEFELWNNYLGIVMKGLDSWTAYL